ncbi:MAG: Hsp33 family molecular chaperone HslO [Ectothiorhodospiraceae bacterium]|nr:Hsp33 family molecular chaperone HslO [Ectothiorhodospiraceae bacterium]
MQANPDQQQRFLFEHANVRGELIHLDNSYQEVLRRREYPDTVARLLGAAMAAAGLLSSTLKFKGSLILQMQGKGPITMLVASASDRQELRAVARHEEGELEDGELQALCRDGYLAITIDPEDTDARYQGIVSMNHASLAGAVDNYFSQSEQLPTRVWLACDGKRAAGLLLQRLPGEDEHGDPDAWGRAEHLASTIKPEELLDLDSREIIRRLFHEETIRLFDPVPVRFHCQCSRQRIASVLLAMGREEADSILEDEGRIQANCDFCGRSYTFDPVDVGQLFSEGGIEPPGRTQH